MSDLYVVRTPHGLVGADERSEREIAKLGEGEILRCTIKVPRNYRFHCKYWAMLNAVYENQDTYPSLESLHFALKIAAGWVSHVVVGEKTHLIPKSTSFEKMTEAEFSEYYVAAKNAVTSLLPAWSAEEIDRVVTQFT